MRPGSLPLAMVRGDDYSLLLTFTDKDGARIPLTGRSYRAQIREDADAPTLLAEFDIDITQLGTGELRLGLDKAVTSALPEFGVWDLEETGTDGKVQTLLADVVTVEPDVTR